MATETRTRRSKNSLPPAQPTDPTFLLRRPELNLRYVPWKRVADRISGRSDGRVDVADLTRTPNATDQRSTSPGIDLDVRTSMWIARAQHTLEERLAHERLAHQAIAAPWEIRGRALAEGLAVAERELGEAAARLRELPTEPLDIERRGPAEVGAPAEVIHMRRRRAHEASVLSPARSRVTALEHQVTQLSDQLHEVVATLETISAVTETRCDRLREFYSRRCATYRRSYLRAARRRGTRAVPALDAAAPPDSRLRTTKEPTS